jgi:tetratricopeptide (TPR) repeat protein
MRPSRAVGLSLLFAVLEACAPGSSAPPAAVVDVKPVPSARAMPVVPDADAGARAVVLPPMDAAQRLASEGRAYAARGEYAAALNQLEAAYRISPSDDLLYDIGSTLEAMGRRAEAASVYEKFLQSDLSHMDRMSMELRIKQLRGGP